MPILKNSRHEKFAQGLASGMSAVEAYEKAGYKPHRQSACNLRTNTDITDRVEELKQAAAQEANIDRAYILKFLHDIAIEAREAGQFAPSTNAIVKVGEEALDMFIAKSKAEHTFKGEPNELTKEQLAAIAAQANGDASRPN